MYFNMKSNINIIEFYKKHKSKFFQLFTNLIIIILFMHNSHLLLNRREFALLFLLH
jgi:hypothetical protein